MARIRTIKPEFWDSPDTARASLRARLFFIAMWNWADDYGIGTANGKQLIGFAFPNDDDITAKDFPTLSKEVADCFGVVYFEHEGRPYFTVPSWDKHQRTERKAKKNEALIAAAEQAVWAQNHAEVESTDAGEGFSDASHGGSGAGTGEREQGNRGKGTEETSEIEPLRPDVEQLLDQLDFEIEKNGARAPKRNKSNRDAMRLLMDRDGYTFDQVAWMISWCQSNEFWRSNILSAAKLREKFDQMKLQAQRKQKDSGQSRAEAAHSFIESLREEDESRRSGEAPDDRGELR